MNHSDGPLNAARGLTLGCVFSGVIWLAIANIIILGGHISI